MPSRAPSSTWRRLESNLGAEFSDVNRGRLQPDARSAQQHNTQLFMHYLSLSTISLKEIAKLVSAMTLHSARKVACICAVLERS